VGKGPIINKRVRPQSSSRGWNKLETAWPVDRTLSLKRPPKTPTRPQFITGLPILIVWAITEETAIGQEAWHEEAEEIRHKSSKSCPRSRAD